VDTKVFNLSVQCDDSTDTKITLGVPSNSQYEFNFFESTNTNNIISVSYSHSNCETPSVKITDQSGTELTFFSTSVSGTSLILTALPQSIVDVGTHKVKIAFTEPREQNFDTVLFTFIVADPCTSDQV
jgi:hypothetical protein